MNDPKTPHPIDLAVGARVREARLASGLSQGALGARIGLTFQQVQKYENGANRISCSKLVEIADILGLPPAHFLEGLGVAKPATRKALPALDTPGAAELLERFAALPPALRSAVLQLAASLHTGATPS